MKTILAILLLLTTAFYVLPVSNGLMAENEVACKCVDEKTDDKGSESKKEKGKEFIAGYLLLLAKAITTIPVVIIIAQDNSPVHNTIETPPPDRV
jgi:hypothetical protein